MFQGDDDDEVFELRAVRLNILRSSISIDYFLFYCRICLKYSFENLIWIRI